VILLLAKYYSGDQTTLARMGERRCAYNVWWEAWEKETIWKTWT